MEEDLFPQRRHREYIHEIYGPSIEMVDIAFCGSVCRICGLNLDELAHESGIITCGSVHPSRAFSFGGCMLCIEPPSFPHLWRCPSLKMISSCMWLKEPFSFLL
jgi:hypothetical protein